MTQETEVLEQEALQSNIKKLIQLRDERGIESAEQAIRLAQDSVGILFKEEPEPEGEEEKLAAQAGRARFESGIKIQIWGNEGNWDVFIPEEYQKDEHFQSQRDLVQKACDAGLRSQTDEAAGRLAVDTMARSTVERKLLQLAGSNDLNQPPEKSDRLVSRLRELRTREEVTRYWTITARTDFNQLPEIRRVSDVIKAVSK